MGLFGKKKDVKNSGEGSCMPEVTSKAETSNMESSVKVLGSGCAKCRELEKVTRAALEELGMNSNIEHVTDFVRIAAYGVMITPALVVDGKVVSYGKVLKKDEIKALLCKVRK